MTPGALSSTSVVPARHGHQGTVFKSLRHSQLDVMLVAGGDGGRHLDAAGQRRVHRGISLPFI